jgi:DSF synthase
MRRGIKYSTSFAPRGSQFGSAAVARVSSDSVGEVAITSAAEPGVPLLDRRPVQGEAEGGADRSSSEQSRFLSRTYDELQLKFDANSRSLWSYLRPKGGPCFTPSMVGELIAMHRALQGLMAAQTREEQRLIRYYVQRSLIPGIYNMGGDFGFLIDRITLGDWEAIRRYAHDCVDAVFHIATGFDSGIVTVCLLEGDALGGGLEGALCCNYIVAERKVKLGFPEILFNCFPGMGAYSLLARRISPSTVERMIFSGKVFSAKEMYELGVIDLVVDDGAGEKHIWDYIADERKFSARQSIYQARNRINPITLSELRDVTDLWVRTAMNLTPADLRRMKHLQLAQARRLQQASARF